MMDMSAQVASAANSARAGASSPIRSDSLHVNSTVLNMDGPVHADRRHDDGKVRMAAQCVVESGEDSDDPTSSTAITVPMSLRI